MAKDLFGNIKTPTTENPNIDTLFQEKRETARYTAERRTKHKDIALTPTNFETITIIAKAKGYSVNDYITLLIEEDIVKEQDNLEKYKQIYKQAIKTAKAQKEADKEKRKAKLLAELEKLEK